jgi:hypothetical protein
MKYINKLDINFNKWDNLKNINKFEKLKQKWLNIKYIYIINFSIFDISYQKYTILNEFIILKQKKYLLLNDIFGNKIPFYAMYKNNNLTFISVNDIKKNIDKIKKQIIQSTNYFFDDQNLDIKNQIINNIKKLDIDEFIKNKYYKFF